MFVRSHNSRHIIICDCAIYEFDELLNYTAEYPAHFTKWMGGFIATAFSPTYEILFGYLYLTFSAKCEIWLSVFKDLSTRAGMCVCVCERYSYKSQNRNDVILFASYRSCWRCKSLRYVTICFFAKGRSSLLWNVNYDIDIFGKIWLVRDISRTIECPNKRPNDLFSGDFISQDSKFFQRPPI